MTDLGLMNYFLGIEVTKNDKDIFIRQSKYAKDVLKRLRMIYSSPIYTPMATGTKLSREQNEMDFDSTIGWKFECISQRRDIMYGFTLISRVKDKPKNSQIHRHTKEFTLYSTSNNLQLVGYTQEALMTEKAHLDMHFILEYELWHGHQRSNQ